MKIIVSVENLISDAETVKDLRPQLDFKHGPELTLVPGFLRGVHRALGRGNRGTCKTMFY